MPHLVIFNPPERLPDGSTVVGRMSRDVHAILYTHEDDGEDYEHPFDEGVEMLAIQRPDGARDILVRGIDGQPMWDDV